MTYPRLASPFDRAVIPRLLALACLTTCPACDAATRRIAQEHAPQTQPGTSGQPGQPDEAPAPPDKDGEFVEYRYLPEVGQIIFTDNSVRGVKRVQSLKEQASQLAEKGIYAFADEAKRHVYPHSQKVGQRMIESAVVIDPPTHEGDNGEYFTARLLVKVDGRRKIDCTLGTTPDGELSVSKVVIHADDGSVEIHALSGDGNELNVPENQESLDDRRIITNQSFYDDDPSAGAAPVRA